MYRQRGSGAALSLGHHAFRGINPDDLAVGPNDAAAALAASPVPVAMSSNALTEPGVGVRDRARCLPAMRRVFVVRCSLTNCRATSTSGGISPELPVVTVSTLGNASRPAANV